MIKILYSVQATGNGHISRAHQLVPYLEKHGQVDIMLSGSNATLQMDLPIKFRSRGLSLFYSRCGGLDYWKSIKSFNYNRIVNEAKALPVEKYDVIINDFDHITAKACSMKKVKSVQLGHQASFMSANTPRPGKTSFFGEMVLKHYAPAAEYIGLHFEKYDHFIFPPIIKDVFLTSKPLDHGHITAYIPAYQTECIKKIFRHLAPIEVHWFLPHISTPYQDGNIHYFPVDQAYFNDSLIHCHGLVTGGGFETPAEALYLGKKLLTIPIDGQYEQQCNAAALGRLGIPSIPYLDNKTKETFYRWVHMPAKKPQIQANNIDETVQKVLALF